MNNTIYLEFNRMVSRLAGFDYGKRIFDEQVKGKIDYTEQICIIFPEQIVRIASSFVQGFFEQIVSKIGIIGVRKQVIVKASSQEVVKSIMDNLE